ncbi:hypothetical protein PAHAL_6G117800 [Panicum hallii]|uniref:Uncharacterized protein n=1 Tax=Panicum hallii TaxID=206008 RepID=A0A2S3I1Y2_9POAL|nr:hypothetical protein PAHAL_6G117800 [Panicum hallii]
MQTAGTEAHRFCPRSVIGLSSIRVICFEDLLHAVPAQDRVI